MSPDRLREILDAHARWLNGDKSGCRADLCSVDLCGADLCDADLRDADLRGTDLRGANLYEADLRGANLRGANLSRANLCGADLYEADLRGVNLHDADFHNANLCAANLRGSDLRGADLRGADLIDANLRVANLRGANLSGANLLGAELSDADLCGADLSDVEWNHTTVGIHAAPQGELRAWGRKGGKIVEMVVPKEARRSCATTRKMRAEYVDVVSVNGDTTGNVEAVVRNEYGTTVYRAGQRVHCHEWCEDRWQECAGGIHFFLTREEAEEWP